jgi:predicted transcriptional regulator
MSKRNFEQIGVSIERADLKAIRHIAVDEDVSAGHIIREAIRDYLDRRESRDPVNGGNGNDTDKGRPEVKKPPA